MSRRVPAEVFPPGEIIREELGARGWTQSDLAEILGRPLVLVNEIVTGRRAIMPETARGLGDAFGVDPQFFLNLESAYQLWRVETNRRHDQAVARRASLYEKVPVREFVRRGWIERSENIEVLENRVLDLLGIKTFEEQPRLWPAVAKTFQPSLSLAHWAWLARAKQLARAVSVARFSESSISGGIRHLKTLLHTSEETRQVPEVLAHAGVRFVIVEHLPGTRIDGACLWLDPKSPVIVLSLRYDRIDHFWHTLMHEIGHVKNRHGLKEHYPLDIDILGEDSPPAENRPEVERLVDDFAADTLIPKAELDYFVLRARPLFSKQEIRGFAAQLQIHPGIVVGQLQHRRVIDWRHSRDMLARIRQFLVGAALTDGWGNRIPLPAA